MPLHCITVASRGLSATAEFLILISDKQWSRSAVDRLLWKTDVTGSAERKCGGGRKRTASTSEKVDADEELAFSQKDAPTLRPTNSSSASSPNEPHPVVVTAKLTITECY